MTTATAEEAVAIGATLDHANLDDISNPIGSHIFLLPEDLDLDPEFDVRPWSTEHGQEQEEIDSLAEQIKTLGQLDDLIIIPNKSGRHTVLAGHRRRLAVAKLNKERKKGTDATRLRCRIETDPDEIAKAFEKAVSSNQDRLNMGPMNTALLIQRLRPKHGSEAKGTAEIAKILRLKSKASVTQHERLLGDECSDTIREGLHSGVISMESAMDMMRAVVKEPEKVAEVIETGRKIQEKASVKSIEKKAAAGTIGKAEAAKRVAAVKTKKRVEAPAIRQALREAAPEAKIKRTMKDVKSFFKDMAGDYAPSSSTGQPKYGYPDGAIQQFLSFFAGPEKAAAWLDGEGTNGTLQKKWDALVDNVPLGTKASLAALREKEEREAEQLKKQKAQARAAKAAEAKGEDTPKKTKAKVPKKKAVSKAAPKKSAAKSKNKK